MVNPCAQGCCNCRLPFFIYKDEKEFAAENPMPSSTATNTQEPGKPTVAQITKVWAGMKKECFTTADSFEFKSPDGATDEAKLRLLGATIMIDQLFFEGGDDKDGQ